MALIILADWLWKMPELPVDSWWFLAIVLVFLVFTIWLVARLTPTLTDDIDPAETHRQMLTAVRELHSQGELTPEEYRSIKSQLIERLAQPSASADSEGYSKDNQQGQESRGGPYPTAETPEDNTDSTDDVPASTGEDAPPDPNLKDEDSNN